jgi:hypothetical protein
MWNQISVVSWSAISSTPSVFTLRGGNYGITLHATTWGTATLQRQTPDGGFVTVLTAFSADGYQNITLPNGKYQLTLSGIAALSGDIVSIVQDQ